MLIYLQNKLFPLTTFDIQLGAVLTTEASLLPVVGRDSPVSIVTRYALDGSGFKSLWGRDISSSPDRPRGPHSLPRKG
jgi:hypothetical protein